MYQVRLPIVDNKVCEEAYLEIADYLDFNGSICAGSVESGGIGFCNVYSIYFVFFTYVLNLTYFTEKIKMIILKQKAEEFQLLLDKLKLKVFLKKPVCLK